MFLEKRPSDGEILLRSIFDAEVFEECLIWKHFSPVVDHGIRSTLARLKELGFDCWSLETTSIPLVGGKSLHPVPANVMALFDARICDDSDPAEAGKLLFPVTQAEYENIPDKFIRGTPTVYSFNGLKGREVAIWPVPQVLDGDGAITCNALTSVRYPFRMETWPPYWLESSYRALSAGLAYNIKRRWPLAFPPVEYLEEEAERAYRLLGPYL